MRSKTDLEMERAAILKMARSIIRAKYAAMADEELNRVLPRLEDEMNKALSSGKEFRFNIRRLLDA